MNSTTILTGVLSCLLLMLAVTHSFTLSGQTADGQQHQLLIGQPSVVLPNKFISIDPDDDDVITDDSDGHELEKRRFNAWAGKRSNFGKRRFNAWAGRR